MIEVLTTDDKDLLAAYDSRIQSMNTLWSVIEKDYKKNKSRWDGTYDEGSYVKRGPRVKINRQHRNMETQIAKLIVKPVQPLILAANETDEAGEAADAVQQYALYRYNDANFKKQYKIAIRNTYFARLFCVKIIGGLGDFRIKAIRPTKIKISGNASAEGDADMIVETVDDKYLTDLLTLFPNKQEKILRHYGYTLETAKKLNPKEKWEEVWIGDGVFWRWNEQVLNKVQNPYYDFEGLLVTESEAADLISDGDESPKLNGRGRRKKMAIVRSEQSKRRENENKDQFETIFDNFFDKPHKPYVYGSVLETDNKPFGDATTLSVTGSLEDAANQSKRQIAANAEIVNGQLKVDTAKVTMSDSDIQRIRYDPKGIIKGNNVMEGVKREFGQGLPAEVFKDMEHSLAELDQTFGTSQTFKGEQGSAESATGRAILREESNTVLNEMEDMLKNITYHVYGWIIQMMWLNQADPRMVKRIGAAKAQYITTIMRDDLQQGISVRQLPGQAIPDDRIFRAEKAKEDLDSGIIDPLTYMRQTGGYDNPEEVLKTALKFKTNPWSLVTLNEEDIRQMQQAQQILQLLNPPPEQPAGDPRAQQAAKMRQRIEQLTQSPEFAQLPPEQQQAQLAELRSQLANLSASQA